MITRDYFVIFNSTNAVKLTGQTGDLNFILANLSTGDTYNWRDQIAAEANGVVWVPE